jgi:hypothetical protein
VDNPLYGGDEFNVDHATAYAMALRLIYGDDEVVCVHPYAYPTCRLYGEPMKGAPEGASAHRSCEARAIGKTRFDNALRDETERI